MANIIDVAKKAGVSISTVSNVINGTKFVGKELTERVLSAIDELGYQANEMAASMKRRETRNIGVVFPNIRMIFFPEVLEGIETAAKEYGYKILYFSTDYDFEKEKEYLHLLKSSWVDGIVIDSCCASNEIEEYQNILISNPAGKTVPVVALETPFSSDKLGVITFNQIKYTKESIDYLVGQGRRKIWLLVGPPELPVYEDTMSACSEVFESHNLIFDSSCVLYGDYFAESGYTATKAALENGAEIDAIYAENDQMAIGAMKAIKEFKKRIPEDIAVIGADGIFVTSIIDPSLTSVELPRYELGYKSIQLLREMITDHPDRGEHIELEGKLIIRKSTDSSVEEDWGLKGW